MQKNYSMLKKLLFTILGSFALFNSMSQTTWTEISSNLPAIAADAGMYEIQTLDNGVTYLIFNRYDFGAGAQVIEVLEYTPGGAWINIETIPTTVLSMYNKLSSTKEGDNVYFWIETGSTDEMALYSITGGTVAHEGTTLNGIITSSGYGIKADPWTGELYSYYDSMGNVHVHKFNFTTDSWGPFISTGGLGGSELNLHIDNDSLFMSMAYMPVSDYELRFLGANKSTPNFTPIDGPSVFYQPGNNVVESSTGKHLVLGDGNYRSIIMEDLGTMYDIPVSNTFGVGNALTFGAGAEIDGVNTYGNSYFLVYENDDLNVYERDHLPATIAQFGSLVESSANRQDFKIDANSGGTRVTVANRDNTTFPMPFKIWVSNIDPTIEEQSTFASYCGGMNAWSLFEELTFEDLDGDLITYVGGTSTNNSILDPASIVTDPFQIGNSTFMGISADIAQVSSPTTVTLSLTFTDGYSIIQVIETFTILPSTIVSYTQPLIFCNSEAAFDLNELVDLPGGQFSINETWIADNMFNPQDYSMNDTMILSYYIPDIGCTNYLDSQLVVLNAPEINTLQVLDASACGVADGLIDVTVTAGQSSNYTYQWSNNITNSLFNNNLLPGLYFLEVLDDNGCIAKESFSVGVDNVNVTSSLTHIECFGDFSGEISIDNVNGLTPPYNYLWTNGQSQNTATNLSAGNHFVTIKDANGCEIVETFTLNQPSKLVVQLWDGYTDCGQSDGELYTNITGGVTPYTYNWSNGATTEDISNLPHGFYSVDISDANGCQVTKQSYVYEEGSPTLNYEITNTDCNVNNGAIDVSTLLENGETTVSYLWSNGAVTEDISGLNAGIYTLEVVSDLNCHNYRTIEIKTNAPQKNEICVITVDDITTTNLIVWEKPITTEVDYYNIYRETSVPNQYLWIDSVEYEDISTFNDVVISPLMNSWRYKISAVNECDVESAKSFAHRTMHLNIEDLGSGQFKVKWNKYEGTSYANFIVSRYTTGNGWEEIITLPSTQITYVDVPSSVIGLDYRVEISLTEPCTATEEKAEDYNYIRSNREKGQFQPGIGEGGPNNSIQSVTQDEVLVLMYPNPVNDILTIELSGKEFGTIHLVDASGKLIRTLEIHSGVNKIDFSELDAGMYTIQVGNFNYTKKLRFIKQ